MYQNYDKFYFNNTTLYLILPTAKKRSSINNMYHNILLIKICLETANSERDNHAVHYNGN